MPKNSLSDWQQFIEQYPNAHILQTPTWGKLKTAFGWKMDWVICKEGIEIGAQIYFRNFAPGINLAYIPKGPVYDLSLFHNVPEAHRFWDQVDLVCRSRKAFILKIEPDIWIKREPIGKGLDKSSIQSSPDNDTAITEVNQPVLNFSLSDHTIQPRRTTVIDLSGDENDILSQMKQKTRYNIKLALRNGIVVQPSTNIELFYDLLKVTGDRDRFGIHSLAYYQAVFDLFYPRNECQLFLAQHQGEALAGLLILKNGQRSWYFYGASNNKKRELMPTYILQWEAIRWARSQGCMEYDLWGVPDFDLDYLEDHFTSKNDDLWGVYRFKRGFGGELRRSIGAWDRIYNPFLYTLYQWWIQRQSNTTTTNT
jgi:peptidoglycan pentaglycine glycine transferase (the first glycine)